MDADEGECNRDTVSYICFVVKAYLRTLFFVRRRAFLCLRR